MIRRPQAEPARPYPIGHPVPQRIEDAFIGQAARAPDKAAVLHRGRMLSYGALDALSSRIAHRLRSMGVGRNRLVALYMGRSPQMIAAMLAVLKAGGAYLPLDPAYPAERLSFMLGDSGAAIMMTDALVPADIAFEGDILDLDRERLAIEAEPTTRIDHGGSGADLAYVIYTSGSTGRPKGVMLAHSATHLIEWLATDFAPQDVARIAASTSICFDPSIIEIFGTLGIGSLIVLKRDAFERFEPEECPTLFGAPPSILGELARLGAIPDSVRILVVGGEPLTAALVQQLFQSCRAEAIHNQYGLTETTTCSTEARIRRGDLAEPTIGRPMAGARVYLLDEQGQPVPPGTPGEIHIAGPIVALGYWGAGPAQARFREDPFVPGERLYRTGDLGCWREDGHLVFKGRVDSLVKLRGFRVEIGEVEVALLRLPHVRQAAAAIQQDERGRNRLVAFLASDGPIDAAEARRQLARWLPAHMLPARFQTMASLPLASTGKVDRARLARAFGGEAPSATPPVASTAPFGSTVEEIIARTFSMQLDCPVVGPTDDFYDLGGDSLLALNVAAELEDLFGKAIEPALLAHHASPRALAEALSTVPSENVEILAPLQQQGHGPILFCTPDLYGRPLSYVSLARRLGPSQRVTGLSPGSQTGAFLETPDVRMLSHIYLEAIRVVQPSGPYLVSGYSFGAVQAFDLACLMEAEGETALFVLIDGPLSSRRPSLPHILRWLGRETPATLRARGVAETIKGIGRSWALWTRLLSGSRHRVRRHEVPGFVPAADRALARALMQSVTDYRPQPFAGRCLLIRCGEPYPLFKLADEDGRLGWRDWLTGPIEERVLPGTHMRMMQEPVVGEVAAILEAASATLSRSLLGDRAEGGVTWPKSAEMI